MQIQIIPVSLVESVLVAARREHGQRVQATTSHRQHALGSGDGACRYRHRWWSECLSRRVESTAREFKPQESEIANTLWALATAGVQILYRHRWWSACRGAGRAESTALAGEFNPQDIANMLWASAVLETIPLF